MKRDEAKHTRVRARRDVPMAGQDNGQFWGSDAIAEMLRALGVPYVVVNPGASFRGLHDSIVNHLGNREPQMLLVLHEEHAVAIAHGYAKVTGKPLAAILHSNVGLMHGSMAIFDAWADRVPVLVLGATGPVDSAQRRPWIDWLHTSTDQAALVRHFIKWDAQPASVAGAQEAMLRANRIANTAPRGPVYVCFDAALQEQKLERMPGLPDVSRYAPPQAAAPAAADIQSLAGWLTEAKRPVILAGRVSRSQQGWDERVMLAERFGARVITDMKQGAAFPTRHPLHSGPASTFLHANNVKVLREADLVISLDWSDLAGTLAQAWGKERVGSRIVQVSVDHHVHNGWSMDHQALPPADMFLACEPEPFVAALLAVTHDRAARGTAGSVPAAPAAIAAADADGASGDAVAAAAAVAAVAVPGAGDPLLVADVARILREETAQEQVTLMRLPLSWSGEMWDHDDPLDYLGYDGGAGIGSGPGMAVGSALALQGSGRLPVAIIGDGDYLMGVTAFWTAATARIPLLTLVVNNRSFFNDEVHQERVAVQRARPVENKWIGQRIDDPAPDLAMMARGQGLHGIGPVEGEAALREALRDAIARVKRGEAVVADVRVKPGYSPTMAQGMTRSHSED